MTEIVRTALTEHIRRFEEVDLTPDLAPEAGVDLEPDRAGDLRCPECSAVLIVEQVEGGITIRPGRDRTAG